MYDHSSTQKGWGWKCIHQSFLMFNGISYEEKNVGSEILHWKFLKKPLKNKIKPKRDTTNKLIKQIK